LTGLLLGFASGFGLTPHACCDAPLASILAPLARSRAPLALKDPLRPLASLLGLLLARNARLLGLLVDLRRGGGRRRRLAPASCHGHAAERRHARGCEH
jgi:hypothetical protein